MYNKISKNHIFHILQTNSKNALINNTFTQYLQTSNEKIKNSINKLINNIKIYEYKLIHHTIIFLIISFHIFYIQFNLQF